MLIIKGFLIGIAKIIPGVSGAVLALSLGVYEKAVEAISNIFKDFKNSFKLLFPLGIGIIIAIILGSKILIYFLNNYYEQTLLLFIGLMLGGIPDLIKKIDFKKLKIKHYLLLIISFTFIFLLDLINKQTFFTNDSNLLYIIIGSIDAVTMVVPGISGTAIMMLLGCYQNLLNLIGNLSNYLYLFEYGISMLISTFIISKMMNYLFKNKELTIYSIVVGFMVSSLLILFFSIFESISILGIILLIIGFLLGYNLG